MTEPRDATGDTPNPDSPPDANQHDAAEVPEGELVEQNTAGDGEPVTVGSSEVGPRVVAAAARSGGQAQPVASLADADLADRTQDVQFKKLYGRTILGLVGGQLVIADVAFVWYAFARSWNIEGYVMASWLSATVVQVVGLTWIVVRSLFPPEPPRPRQNNSS